MMRKTVVLVKGMDCTAEEQMVRMALSGSTGIRHLDFDLPNRKVTVLHENPVAELVSQISTAGLGSELVTTNSDTTEVVETNSGSDRTLLWRVLFINLAAFIIGITFGLIANSMGLVADSLDELADALVYAMAIYAIAGSAITKIRIARLCGVLQLLLAMWGFWEVIRRFIGNEPVPDFRIMIAVSIIALIGNVTSLTLLNKSKSQEVHIKATQIFTANDVIVNLGVILAAILVATLHSKIPDLIIGSIVFAIVLRGSLRIFKLAKNPANLAA